MTQLQFDHLIAPLTRDKFFRDYWGKSFLHIRGQAGRFADIFGWGDLNAILEQQRIAAPLFKVLRDGQDINPDRYSALGLGYVPRLNAGRLISCLAEGATLILDCVEDLSPKVRDLSGIFRDALRTRNYVNLYAGWHREKGLDLHWDSQEIMILQISGRKRWQVYAPTRLHPLDGEVDIPPRPQGNPVWDGIVEDGDVLYLPRGWWHVAFPLQVPSLHLTIGAVPANGYDLLKWVAERLRGQLAVRQDLPVLRDPASQKQRMGEIRNLVGALLTDGLIADFQNEWEAETRPTPHIHLPDAPYQQAAPIVPESRIRLASSHGLFFRPDGDFMEFKAYNELYGVQRELMPALQLLSDTKSLSVADLSAVLPSPATIEALKKCLGVLARAGVILVERNNPRP